MNVHIINGYWSVNRRHHHDAAQEADDVTRNECPEQQGQAGIDGFRLHKV